MIIAISSPICSESLPKSSSTTKPAHGGKREPPFRVKMILYKASHATFTINIRAKRPFGTMWKSRVDELHRRPCHFRLYLIHNLTFFLSLTSPRPPSPKQLLLAIIYHPFHTFSHSPIPLFFFKLDFSRFFLSWHATHFFFFALRFFSITHKQSITCIRLYF